MGDRVDAALLAEFAGMICIDAVSERVIDRRFEAERTPLTGTLVGLYRENWRERAISSMARTAKCVLEFMKGTYDD